MSNLVIAILAIGLAAIAAMAAAYYGGASFIQGQGRANAIKDINYLSQIAGAVHLWSDHNGGTMPEPSKSYPSACTNSAYCSASDIQTIVGTRYLATTATPNNTDAGELLYWNETLSAMQNPVLLLRLGTAGSDKTTCLAIETLRQNSVPAALRVYNGGTVDINRYMCGDTGCFQNDGTFGATGSYLYIVYMRLRGMPNTSSTDYPGLTCPTS